MLRDLDDQQLATLSDWHGVGWTAAERQTVQAHIYAVYGRLLYGLEMS